MHSNKAICIILLCCSLTLPTIIFSQPDNFCHDKQNRKEQDALVSDNPNDMEIHTLHARRTDLCVKVDRDQITVGQTTDIFESARETIIKRRGEELELEQDKRKF
jgi:hypothetical protein